MKKISNAYNLTEADFLDKRNEIMTTYYGRVSTLKEEQKASSVYQERGLDDVIRQHSNWVDVGENYFDLGITGTNVMVRPGFLKMIEDARAGKFQLIVMRDVSRFARYTKQFLEYLEKLHSYGVVVYFSSYNLFSNTSNSQMILNILAVVAEQESRTKSEHTRVGHAYRREQGFVFGQKRYGWDLVITEKGKSNILKVNEEQAAVIRKIFDLYINGMNVDGKHIDCGLSRIAKYLNDNKISTLSNKTIWSISTIGRILSNKCYCGYVRYNTSFKEDLHSERRKIRNKSEHNYIKSDCVECIIDEETFEKAQKKKASRTTACFQPIYDDKGLPLHDEYGNLIKRSVGYKPITDSYCKKLQCECNSTFKVHRIRRPNKEGVRAVGYSCYHYERRRVITENRCKSGEIDKVKIDMLALKIFANNFLSDSTEAIKLAYDMIIDCLQEDVDNKLSGSRHPSDIQKEIYKIGSKKKILLNKFLSDEISEEDYEMALKEANKKIEDLTNEKRLLEEELNKLKTFDGDSTKDQVLKTLQSFTDITEENEWHYQEVKKSIIDTFVSKIVVHKENKFDWYLNLNGVEPYAVTNKFAPDYHDRYKINENAVFIGKITIGYEEANAFVKSYGRSAFHYKKKNGEMLWHDLEARVYVEL